MQIIAQTGEQAATELSDYEKERGKPLPDMFHAMIQTSLAIQLHKQTGDRFLFVSELTLEITPTSSLTPDLAVLPKRPLVGMREPARCKDIPLLVVEIAAPSQGYEIMVRKIDTYFAYGVQGVWEINPALRAIAIHRLGQEVPEVFQHGEAKDPATGLTVRVEEIFS